MHSREAIYHSISYTGSLAFAAGSFVLAFFIQKTSSDPVIFATFSLMQTMLGACANFVNGFSTIPLTKTDAGEGNEGLYVGYVVVYAALSVNIGPIFAYVSEVRDVSLWEYIYYSIIFLAYNIRWAIKGFSLSRGQRFIPSLSDYGFLLSIFAGISIVYAGGEISYPEILGVFLISLLLSGAPMAMSLLGATSIMTFSAQRFFEKIRRESIWSTATVFFTDLGSNSHVYAIYTILGGRAFAPVALAALMARPVGVCLTSIIQIERKSLFDIAISNDRKKISKKLRMLWAINISVLLIYSAVALSLITVFENEVIGIGYDLRTIFWVYALLSLTLLCKIFREPILAVVQSRSGFRGVTWSGFVFFCVSMVGTFGQMVAGYDPNVYTMVAAVVLSEVLYTGITIMFYIRAY